MDTIIDFAEENKIDPDDLAIALDNNMLVELSAKEVEQIKANEADEANKC